MQLLHYLLSWLTQIERAVTVETVLFQWVRIVVLNSHKLVAFGYKQGLFVHSALLRMLLFICNSWQLFADAEFDQQAEADNTLW